MSAHDEDRDVPLPGTLWFVLVMAAAFAIGWFLLYGLMLGRW